MQTESIKLFDVRSGIVVLNNVNYTCTNRNSPAELASETMMGQAKLINLIIQCIDIIFIQHNIINNSSKQSYLSHKHYQIQRLKTTIAIAIFAITNSIE